MANQDQRNRPYIDAENFTFKGYWNRRSRLYQLPNQARANFPVLVDGHIYTDDTPFWLGLIQHGERYQVVFGNSNLEDTLTVAKPSWAQWRLWLDDVDKGCHFYDSHYPKAILNPSARLQFRNIEEWERFKETSPLGQGYYRSSFQAGVDNVWDPPPPYSPSSEGRMRFTP